MNNVKKSWKVICQYLGGSHLYGLNTSESDVDERGVFVNTDPAYILGLKRFDESRKQNPNIKEDIVYKEVSHFLRLLQNANSEALEVLFAPKDSFIVLLPFFEQIRNQSDNLVDSKRLFVCLRGYMQGEYRLAIGERKGKIGGKRYARLQQLGFSPKNFTQLFRLAYMGKVFFEENRFPVNLKSEPIWQELMDIKVHPEKFSKEQLTGKYVEAELALVQAFENRAITRKFSENVANQLLLDLYLPFLNKKA